MCKSDKLLLRHCCFGVELKNGVTAWAIIDILFHLLFLPLPHLNGIVMPTAVYMVAWILAVLIADVLLLIGTKSDRPAYLTMWMVLTAVSTICSFLLLTFIIVCLAMSQDSLPSWSLLNKTVNEIKDSLNLLIPAILAMVIMITVPLAHGYFWLVVRSLRKRLLMEIEIGFDAEREAAVRNERTVWDWLYKNNRINRD